MKNHIKITYIMRCKRRGYFTLKKSNINFKTYPNILRNLAVLSFGFLLKVIFCCAFLIFLKNRAFSLILSDCLNFSSDDWRRNRRATRRKEIKIILSFYVSKYLLGFNSESLCRRFLLSFYFVVGFHSFSMSWAEFFAKISWN